MATLIAVYGVGLVTPLGWMYAGIVWAYAFACFLVTDPVKLLAYKVLDTVKADTRSSTEAEPKPDARAQPRQATEAAEADAKPLPKAAPAPAAPPAARPAANPAARRHVASPPLDAKLRLDPGPSPGADNAKVATLMDTKLGDVLLSAVLKDPAGAGHFIAQAIDDAESSEAVAAPHADKAATPVAPTPKAAE